MTSWPLILPSWVLWLIIVVGPSFLVATLIVEEKGRERRQNRYRDYLKSQGRSGEIRIEMNCILDQLASALRVPEAYTHYDVASERKRLHDLYDELRLLLENDLNSGRIVLTEFEREITYYQNIIQLRY